MVAMLGVCSVLGCGQDDPFAFDGPRSCSIPDQNQWVYDLMSEVYLWADEMPEVDPATFEAPGDLVAEVRYAEFDRWSHVSDLERTEALFQEGKVVAFGLRTKYDDQDRLRLASVHANSPAGAAGLQRGDEILTIAGLTPDQITEQDLWGDIYGPNEPGAVVDFEIQNQAGEVRSVTLTKDWVTIETVPLATVLDTPVGPVGYLVFTTFVDTSFDALDEAFATFRSANVHHVVIDLRYNGGGLISVARYLMNLLVGSSASGEVAYKVQYSASLADNNASRDLAEEKESIDGLDQVVFLTTGNTLSASELVINGVLPHARVSVVGTRTGGKPVGARQWAFCESVIAPITFKLLNANDEGNYFDGFEPRCEAADDLDTQLGDPAEGILAEALYLLDNGDCSPPAPDEEPPPGGAVLPDLGWSRAASERKLEPGSFPGIDGLRGLR
jgi:hypothetical protein